MRVQAVLFDFDGTLADTMENHFLCWKGVLKEFGADIEAEDYYPMEGASLNKIAEKYIGYENQALIENIVRRKKQMYVDLHRDKEVSFYPGVIDLIQFLTKKYPLAIVTAGHEDQLKQTVPTNFLSLFSTIVCGDSVKQNKPSPEPYLEACKQLKKKPGTCVVVENAPLGVISAVNAGCYCIGVESTCGKQQLSDAHETIGDIKQLLDTKVFTD